LFGMNPADSGEIRLDGAPIQLNANRQAIAAGIAYVPEDRLTLGLALEQSIGANMIVTILPSLVGPFGLIDASKRRAAVEAGIDDLTIKVSDPGNAVKTLSGGNQQRVVLAKWMATKPRLLILDSPTVGVDISAKDGIYEIVRKLAEAGVAIIMISDEIPEVFYHSHRVVIMRNGRFIGEFLPAQSSEDALKDAVNA